jgi:hypothetical protein
MYSDICRFFPQSYKIKIKYQIIMKKNKKNLKKESKKTLKFYQILAKVIRKAEIDLIQCKK